MTKEYVFVHYMVTIIAGLGIEVAVILVIMAIVAFVSKH